MKTIPYLLCFLLLLSCNQTSVVNDKNVAFDLFKENFVESLWEVEPVWASFEGYHAYDSLLPIPDSTTREAQRAFIRITLSQLADFKIKSLNISNVTDYHLIRNNLEKFEWDLNEFKSYQWNPASYNLGGAFYQVINYKGAPLDYRIMQIYHKLTQVPAYYEAARRNIDKPTVEHTDLAIKQIRGSKTIFTKTLADSLAKSTVNSGIKREFEIRLNKAANVIDDYVSWLTDTLRPALIGGTPRSFRLPKALYEQKFKYDIQSAYSAEEIFAKAVEAKTELHEKMKIVSDRLWNKYFGSNIRPENELQLIKIVIDTIAAKHSHRDSFIQTIKHQIPELETFIRKNDILFLDPQKPLVVRETPLYQRGIAGASISAPGPYDKNAETYYNVTPLDDYSDESAESYLREYNHYILQILNIHEAVPGHYTQLIYSNQSPSIIKSIFGNGAMVEGWAVYGERMMLEEGYGNHEDEMWLMYYKWNLRTVCNTILDYSVHVLRMKKEDALDLLINQAFQEQAEAENKWRRVTLTQVQLCSYFTGFYEIYSFREELKKEMLNTFNLKKFHEDFLSYGSAPVKEIRRLMKESGDYPSN